MDKELSKRKGETAAHLRLKRLALVWAQAHGYSACGFEVSLPQCRYRADVAAYRPGPQTATALFECKQARPDLRRDNCCIRATRERLETVHRRRQILERNLRVHYPTLRVADSLFPEFDSHDFGAIEHRNYARVLRELSALQHRLYDCAKFETIIRYRCANVCFLVLTEELYRESDVPIGWGALVAGREPSLTLIGKPVWHETTQESRVRFLQRIAMAGTRALNREVQVSFEEVVIERRRLVL